MPNKHFSKMIHTPENIEGSGIILEWFRSVQSVPETEEIILILPGFAGSGKEK